MACLLPASGMVVFLRPSAVSSGMPELIAFLNGTIVRDIFSIKTLIVKFLSCALAVGGGMPAGMPDYNGIIPWFAVMGTYHSSPETSTLQVVGSLGLGTLQGQAGGMGGEGWRGFGWPALAEFQPRLPMSCKVANDSCHVSGDKWYVPITANHGIMALHLANIR